ncbi:MAG: DNA mismatch repair endonuclease MutL [Flavobacteriaceae bacterium]|tara:strand:- start:11672 stop:13462 length:1791 start_codon:yes stop_codon:yes gene_type:complete
MKDIVKILPENVSNQIAAGEVVQRPASLIKELVENSIDALSDTIQIFLNQSGKKSIKVVDNGFGMSKNDLMLCFLRHSTSKITESKDLFNINSKGFRGEALSSISAVSHLEIVTRRKIDKFGYKIKIKGGEIQSNEKVVSNFGTYVLVKNLFFNVPARRNFLKSDTVELRHIINEFHRISIAHQNVNFSLNHKNSEIFNLHKSSVHVRIKNIFGKKIEENLIPIKEKTSFVKLNGYIIKPEASKKTRGMQFLFVNNRFIKNNFLFHSINKAYEGLLPEKKYPGFFIFLEVDPKSIDINIHPNKIEVRFEDEQSLYSIINSTIKHSLGIFQVIPTIDFEAKPSFEIPYSKRFDQPVPPKIEVDNNFNPFKDGTSKYHSKIWNKSEAIYEEVGSSNLFNSNLINEIISEDGNKIFQIMNSYLITSTRNSLLVIDQERAHQRIIYEKLMKKITKSDNSSQQLIFPVNFILTESQKLIYFDLKNTLTEMGFRLELEGKLNLKITGIPVICSDNQASKIIEDLFDEFENDNKKKSFSYGDLIAKSISQSTSIKKGISLQKEEQKDIVNNLFNCKEQLLSPSQQKIFFSISKSELQNRFLNG